MNINFIKFGRFAYNLRGDDTSIYVKYALIIVLLLFEDSFLGFVII